MARDFLSEIVEYKKGRIELLRPLYQGFSKNVRGADLTRYQVFRKALARPGQVNLIAEIKKASPSKGLICEDFDVLRLAKIYADNGAAAISVLTEDKYFLGKPEYVRKVAMSVPLPVLTKDFILDEVQIYEAFNHGASAILLIAAILEDARLKALLAAAGALDLDCLVEVHNEEEVDRAVAAGAGIIGINNRDLRTFTVDLGVCDRLIPRIPRDRVIVAESGLRTHEDILRLQALGAHAVLIGETFLTAPDTAAKIRAVMRGV